MIPKDFKKYFWDVDLKTIDLATHRQYVVERLFEFGDFDAVTWMRKNFSEDELREILKATRVLTPKSATFWAQVLNINPKDIPCLSKRFREQRLAHWIT